MSFISILAYFRGARESPSGWRDQSANPDSDFWWTMSNNCLDVCVLEFCKLFADQQGKKYGKHHWQNVATQDPARFEADLLDHVGISAAEWEDYLRKIRRYRDKFVAHLDDDRVMRPPRLDYAKLADSPSS